MQVWSYFYMYVCDRVCVVLGAAGMVGSKRDFSAGNSISRAKYYSGSQLSLYFHGCPNFSYYALPLQIWDFLLFWGMGGSDDCFCVLVVARD